MKSFYVLLFLALVGLAIGISDIIYGNQPSTIKAKPILIMQPPFESYIAGTGLIEARSTNVPIGSTVSGVVTKVYVKVGESVKVGDALFGIDDQNIQYKFLTAEAKIKLAETTLGKALHQFQITKNLKNISPEMVSNKLYYDQADTVANAKATMALTKAEVSELKKELERYTIHALMDGQILQCKMRVGEYIEGKSATEPFMIIGSSAMSLRVDVNEYDVWNMHKDAKAVAFVRGHPDLKILLEYDYTEPYIVPKTALTGLSTERTDTRVLQVIYKVKKHDIPLYVGQQLDVFIEASDNNKTVGI